MNTFLNRLLALPIGLQNTLFADFEERILRRVAEAKANDSYDRGIENLFADGGFKILNTQVLNVHASGAETICYTIDKLDRPAIVTVPEAQRILEAEEFAAYRHPKSNRLAIAGITGIRLNNNGVKINVMSVYQPTGTKVWSNMDECNFSAWNPEAPGTQYWAQWQQMVNLSPEFIEERMYLICGLLLPVWKKLPTNNCKVVRLQANDGRILLGRSIDKNKIEGVYQKFSLDSGIKLTNEEIYDLIWNHRQAKQVGGYTLQRNYFKGNNYLEVLAVYGADKIDRLKAIGCFTEMINRVKVFIPLDNAIEVMDKLATLQ
jgi:C-terminal domain on Strawberry notch homologue